jgi:hypothetical protein
MPKQDDFLERLRVASPCHVSWEGMEGDARVRFCSQCSLHVYDISEMTNDEARALFANAEGRVCARLYRRADGTILTRDCPVGLRALHRRVARAAGAALAACLSLFSVAAGQPKQKAQRKQDSKVSATKRDLNIERSPSLSAAGAFAGEVVDPSGAIIAGATVTLTNERTKEKFTATTTDEGAFSFKVSEADDYTLEMSAASFQTYTMLHLRLSPTEIARAQVALPIDPRAMEMGIIITDTPLFNGSGNGTTIFNSKQITSLPHG